MANITSLQGAPFHPVRSAGGQGESNNLSPIAISGGEGCNINLKNNIDNYFAGLFEGDGHIWIQNFTDKKKHNPRFCITFHIKDEPLAKKLLEFIGSGHIRYKLKNNACVLTISSVTGLKRIVKLINGKLRTPKIHKLYSLIDWLNKNHKTNIAKLPIRRSPLNEDGWLSGFVDADGCFSVRHTLPAPALRAGESKNLGLKGRDVINPKGEAGHCAQELLQNNEYSYIKLKSDAKKRRISCKLRIEQRMIDPVTNISYLDILTNIAEFLNCNLNIRKQAATGNEYYIVDASNKVSLNIIIAYFNKYPLLSSKYLDYKDWKEVVLLILENKVYTEEGIKTTNSVRGRMNRQRTYFNWDHIKKIKK